MSALPYISQPRSRTDRIWVGDVWPSFYDMRNVEADNLKKILEHRFANA
jgi:hypothetical protein